MLNNPNPTFIMYLYMMTIFSKIDVQKILLVAVY